jgi:phthalate 4,5-dioxygenase oxygenase subunit
LLTAEDNELLTRSGPGTPLGEALRRYWVPALLSEELPAPDCSPLRARLLGEDLVAFRDSSGQVGLVDAHCAHRGASLFFGRNEECGIRCVYHGWKYDVAGRCVDMPNEPTESNFREKIKLNAYPCRERGGIVWAYMGPAGSAPGLPDLEWATLPEAQRCVSKRLQECNYLQALEGAVDLSHIVFLHRSVADEQGRTDLDLARRDPSPKLEVLDTAGGLVVAARRNADRERYYWRINQFIMPWYTMFPPLVDEGIGGHAFVPIDDGSCWVYNLTWDPTGPLAPVAEGIYGDLIPGTYRSRANRANDFLVDRAVQQAVSYTGIPGFAAQDCAVQESMGQIRDRTREHIGPSDLPIIAVRRRLKEAVEAVQTGREPPGLDPMSQRVRPAALLLPTDLPFQEGAGAALVADSDSYVVRI